MTDAIILEIEKRASYLRGQSLDTIYFGGGSPSILGVDHLRKILTTIYDHFDVANGAEITLEANPDDMGEQPLEQWAELGVNRLSVGIQSFIDERLREMNRAHNAEESTACIKKAHAAGYDDISIDLIYGLAEMTESEWSDQLNIALSLDIQHISAYCLTIEPQTVFGKRLERGELCPVNDDAASNQFLAMRDRLISAGFNHYEVSNFGLPDFYSRHNSAYWSGAHYLGVGPSAHSFDGRSRQWNISNNPLYMKGLEADELPCEIEQMTPANLYNERVMTGLRTSGGLDVRRLQMLTEYNIMDRSKATIQQLILQGLMRVQDDHLILNPEGLLQADRIASELFIIDQ